MTTLRQRREGPSAPHLFIVAPMGAGKTTTVNLGIRCGFSWCDIDAVGNSDPEMNKRLDALRTAALLTGDWNRYNDVYVPNLIEGFNGMDAMPSVLFVHGVNSVQQVFGSVVSRPKCAFLVSNSTSLHLFRVSQRMSREQRNDTLYRERTLLLAEHNWAIVRLQAGAWPSPGLTKHGWPPIGINLGRIDPALSKIEVVNAVRRLELRNVELGSNQ